MRTLSATPEGVFSCISLFFQVKVILLQDVVRFSFDEFSQEW